MPEVIMDADFGADPLDEGQVAFAILHAILALGVLPAKRELAGIRQDPVLLQHLGDDIGHAQVLENPLVDAMAQVGQARHQADLITGQAFARIPWATL